MKPLIIETDIGHDPDDYFALCYLHSAGYDIKAILVSIGHPYQVAIVKMFCKQVGLNIPVGVNGASTPQIFRVSPLYMSNSVSWDITNIIFHIEDDAAMDDWKFGGLDALANGIVIRKKDGEYQHIFNAKTNGHLIDHCQSATYSLKTGGGGYGFRALKAIGGQANSGVVIRLSAQSSDELQVIVQDDLTALQDFHVVAIGHLVV